MNDTEYFALQAISQSSIKTFIENRKAYEYIYVKGLGEKKTTKALDLGSLNHCLLFEPQEFENRYTQFDGVKPNSDNMHKFIMHFENNMTIEDAYCNSYTTKGKNIPVEASKLYNDLLPFINHKRYNGHKELITKDLEIQARYMINEVLNHQGVMKTLVAGRTNSDYDIHKEVSIEWYHHVAPGELLKSKIDELHVDIKNQIAYGYDYKTTRSKNINGFKSSCKYYGYDIQESFYVEAIKYWLKQSTGLDFQVIFRFIPQLNIAPYNVLDVVEFEESDREASYLVWTEALAEIMECKKTGRYDNPSAYTESGVNKMKLNKENALYIDGNDGF